MARVTVEDCLAQIPNRFALTICGSRRARALSEGRGHPLVDCENKDAVTALREISAGSVRFNEDVESTITEFIEEQRRQLRVTTGEHTFLEAASLRALEDDDDDGDEVEAPDVEELQSDPEALHKQAKGAEESSDDEEETTTTTTTETETETETEETDDSESTEEGLEAATFGDDGLAEDDDDSGDDGDKDDGDKKADA